MNFGAAEQFSGKQLLNNYDELKECLFKALENIGEEDDMLDDAIKDAEKEFGFAFPVVICWHCLATRNCSYFNADYVKMSDFTEPIVKPKQEEPIKPEQAGTFAFFHSGKY